MKNRIALALGLSVVITLGAAIAPSAPARAAGPPLPIPTQMALWLADKAGGALAHKAFDALFTKIGLNSLFPEENPELDTIRDLQKQMDGLSKQMANVQKSIDSLTKDVRENGLDAQLIALRKDTRATLDLWDTAFSPIVDAKYKLAVAQERGDAAPTIKNLQDDLLAKRNSFYARYDAYPYGAIPGTIHDFLVPGEGNSVLSAKGKVILASKRFLTATDSRTLRQLYNGLADQEAMAAEMRMERYVPSLPAPPPPLAPGDIDIYNKVRLQWLNDRTDEFVNLPPMIPDDVVIDAGPTPRTTTNLARWYVPASPSPVRFVAGDAQPGSAQAVNTELNTRSVAGADDWGVVSKGSLESILPDLGAGTTVGRELMALDPNSDAWQAIANWQFIWSTSTDPARQCTPAQTDVRLALTVDKASLEWKGRCASEGPGGFLASRVDLPARPIDFMAQGDGPNIGPGADLRSADLSNFNLAGVDLTGANLTNARLFKTNLEGTELKNANLTRVAGQYIVGEPASLPANIKLIGGVLVGPNVDLRGAMLQNEDLSHSNLSGVMSGDTDCTGCTLPANAKWSGLPAGIIAVPGADLLEANLRNAKLAGTNLQGANLARSVAVGADFTGANLNGAALPYVNARGADFTDANLQNAMLARGTYLGADFSGAKLGSATFNDAVARNARFDAADLTKVVASRTDFSGASFVEANLTQTNLSGADLTNADVRRAGLAQGTVTGTIFAGANLQYLRAATLTGAPASLPADWRLLNGALIGPFANVSGVVFPLANLRGANLQGAVFNAGSLAASDLTGANLTGARFLNTDMNRALLTNANLTNAIFTNANLNGTVMTNSSPNNLQGVVSGGITGTPTLPANYRITQGYLVGSNVNLANAKFTAGATLKGDLSAVNLVNATLTDVDLTGSFMGAADLSSATLIRVNMNSVLLSRTNLQSATLTSVSLDKANLSQALLQGIKSSGITGVPQSLPTGWRIDNGVLVGGGFAAPQGNGQKPTVTLTGDKKGRLVGDVGPDLKGDAWAVMIEQQVDTNKWLVVATVLTSGTKDTFTVDMPAGTYRAVVPDQYGYREATSTEVTLEK